MKRQVDQYAVCAQGAQAVVRPRRRWLASEYDVGAALAGVMAPTVLAPAPGFMFGQGVQAEPGDPFAPERTVIGHRHLGRAAAPREQGGEDADNAAAEYQHAA